MKNLKIKLLTLLILIILSSCNTRRLNKQKFESSSSAQSEIRLQDLKNERYDNKRMITLTDSANELYTISIFPSDTFSFSAQHGFRGKAAKIEVTGLLRRVLTRTDSTALRAEKQSSRTYEEQQQIDKSELSRTGGLVKKRWPPVLIGIVLVMIIVIGWFLGRRLTK
ncbi:hypothetical protein SAMN05421813_1633 [Daejeonella rubra]|uniref:Lipoprotein n=1 Tax=Daejeonella rubra TaxID=990371 RepID=A0A1G9Z8Y2_9SPHI|nr:hypothetical protein [Daejeonella rubra]SDN17829.1 hypothetical protein SAMN05421813_1633 [Daejeonella rubra]